MIQGSDVIAILGRDDVVRWPVTGVGSIIKPSQITRCVIVCKNESDGTETVIDSDQSRAAFILPLAVELHRGQLVPMLDWLPGIAAFDHFTQDSYWRCDVSLFDPVHTNGVYCGWFRMRVIARELFLTSIPYPIEVIEELNAFGFIVREFPMPVVIEAIDSSAGILSGDLRAILQTYTNWPVEGIDASASILSGDIQTVLQMYTNWPAEGIDASSAILSGSIAVALQTYTNWPAEGIDSSASILSGSLT